MAGGGGLIQTEEFIEAKGASQVKELLQYKVINLVTLAPERTKIIVTLI